MKLFLLLVSFVICHNSASAQPNLYIPNGISSFVRWPIIEASDNVYYLSYTNDTVNGIVINRYFVSSVKKQTPILLHSVEVMADTAFNPSEYQRFAVSYSFNPVSRRLNVFFVTDTDSSISAPSLLKAYPKTISFVQLDTALKITIPRKPIWHFLGNDRYTMAALNLSIPISGNRTCLSYDVRDTFINQSTTSSASKYLIVDDTGKLLKNDFIGWEPLGNGPYFSNHFTNGDIYKYYNGQYVAKGIFQDGITAAGNPFLFVLDSNFQFQDTFDCSYSEGLAIQPSGKRVILFGNLRETCIFLPTGSLITASSLNYLDLSDFKYYGFYGVGKGNIINRYKPTQIYVTPKSDTDDYVHNATLNFYPIVYNHFDNRLYMYSATQSDHPDLFCVNGEPNLGQIVAIDTSLNEKWVKYVRARPGHCIKSFCIAPADGRNGLLVSGLEFSLADPDNEKLWQPFIYYVDSLTNLGINNPKSSIIITNPVVVYPNPANDYLTIEGGRVGEKVTVRSIVGQQLISIPIMSNKQVLNLSGLPASTYILTLTTADCFSQTIKFTKN